MMKIRRMVIMLIVLGLLFGGIIFYHSYRQQQQQKSRAGAGMPSVAVSTARAGFQDWQQELEAVGSLRASRGIDVTSEITGMVSSVHFRSGDDAVQGQELVQLNVDSDVAGLKALEAAAELAGIVYERDKKQYEIQAVSQATLDADAADLRIKRAQVAEQRALIDKKTLRAPFAGRLGISTVNPGQYVNPGDKIVTLQALDLMYVDFNLPQQELSHLRPGQQVSVVADTYPDVLFRGRISAINPKVDPATRNFLVEATIINSARKLLPGMFVTIKVKAGAAERYLTLPQTAITFNPYGETVFLVHEKGRTPRGEPAYVVQQRFVTIGHVRGDQVSIVKGIRENDIVVTSGQLKLKNDVPVVINNKVQPRNDPAPQPVDE